MNKNIFLALTTIFLFTSCTKFLEEKAVDQITNDNFYKSVADVEAAVDGIYSSARFEAGSGLNIIFPLEHLSDDGGYSTFTNFVAERQQIDLHTFTSANSIIGNIWRLSYNVINRANNVIAYAADSSKIKGSTIRAAQAEARYFRAFYHFRLVQIFGDVPLMMQPADVVAGNIQPRRTATRIVYDSVINDLKYAKDNLAKSYAYTSVDGGRVTSAAAKTLLGKVYLTMAGAPLNDVTGYQLAIDELQDLVDNKASYNLDLNPAYAKIFNDTVAVKQVDKERIYFIRGTSGLPNSLQAFNRMGWLYRTFRATCPTKDFASNTPLATKVYDTLIDLRRTKSVNAFTITNHNSALIMKYVTGEDASDDLVLLRYADVLMMTAEALIELGGAANLTTALAHINNVRRTHGGATLRLLTFTTQNDLRMVYRQERRREFAYEAHRWFDIKRWNIIIPTIKASLADYYGNPINQYDYIDADPNKHKVLPIPIAEIANNPNMTQNPGY
jgi:starch-binding outer membrane protein, SusD/RagB family